MVFKRGFLNTSKAKRAASLAETHIPMKVSKSENGPKLSIGVVDGRGKPDGYTVDASVLTVDLTMTDYPDDTVVITRFPPGDEEDSTICIVSGYIKRRIRNTPGFPHPLSICGTAPAFRIGQSAGKGLGMYATRKLSTGDLILDERPLMLITGDIPTSRITFPNHFTQEQVNQATLFEKEKTIQIAFTLLASDKQKAFLDLHNSHKYDGSGPLLAIARTNGFGIGPEMQEKDATERIGQYIAIYDMLSRINHSCSPNIHRKWSTSSFSMQIRACRNIEKGEEITTHYTTIMSSYVERKADLLSYEIECVCPACLDPVASDWRRLRFQRERLGTLDHEIKLAVQMLDEMEDEGVQSVSCYEDLLFEIMSAYVSLRNLKAVGYGRRFSALRRAKGDSIEECACYVDVDGLESKFGMSFL